MGRLGSWNSMIERLGEQEMTSCLTADGGEEEGESDSRKGTYCARLRRVCRQVLNKTATPSSNGTACINHVIARKAPVMPKEAFAYKSDM